MKKEMQIIIRTPIWINPFAWYAVFWIVVFLLYIVSPSELNSDLDFGLNIFLLFTLVISIAFAYQFNKSFKNKSLVVTNEKTSFFPIIVLLVLYILEVLYSGNVPLVTAISGQNSGYQNFGIPTLHVVIVTFSAFYAIKNILIFVLFRNKVNLFKFILPLMYFVLIFSRGMLLLIVFCTVAVVLCQRRINTKRLLYAVIGLIIIMWVFGIAGNIRVSNQWNNSTIILSMARIDFDPNSIFAPFYWTEEYIICSIRNLNNTIITIRPSYDFGEFLYTLIPDFISKRIWPNSSIVVARVVDVFTSLTTYSYSYSSFGYLGLFTEYLLYIITGIYLQKTRYLDPLDRVVTLAVASFIFGLSIFDAMLQYSGYSFILIWGVLLGKTRLELRRSGIKLKYIGKNKRVASGEKGAI